MKDTKIQWCDSTFNAWIGCSKVSPGCANCYAEAQFGKRFGIPWGPGQRRKRTRASYWEEPLTWEKQAEKSGVRPRIFCGSMMDWLDDEVPIEWLADLLGLIECTPNLDWLLLTKRPQNINARISAAQLNVGSAESANGWIQRHPSVWIGTSVEDQQRADERIPALLAIPARVRFLSCEPLLGQVDLQYSAFNGTDSIDSLEGIHWTICGGESGPHARPMHPEWARSLRDQCEKAGVPFFMKQMGGYPNKQHLLSDLPEDLRIRQFP